VVMRDVWTCIWRVKKKKGKVELHVFSKQKAELFLTKERSGKEYIESIELDWNDLVTLKMALNEHV